MAERSSSEDMRPALQLQRLAFGFVGFWVVSAFTPAAVAFARDDETVLEHLLREARDHRVRARAASALGRTSQPNASAALVTALGDRHPAVRAAAASALGRLATAEALPALRKSARDPAVAKHARDAIARIELDQRRKGLAPQTQTHVRYGLCIGELRDRSPAPAEGMLPVLADSLDEQLRTIEGVQVLDLGAPLDGLPVYRVDGQIVDADRRLLENKVTARASVALLLTDEADKTLRIVFRGAATTIEDLNRRELVQSETERVARLAIERAVRAALRNASTAMSEALARR